MSQEIKILDHLSKKPITALEALQEYGCFRLAARINDLRGKGHKIHTEVTISNGKRYATYHLLKRKPLD